MKAIYVQPGNAIDYTPTADVAAGDVVVLGTIVGVASYDIAANTLGALNVTGVFDMPKASGAITAGAAVYWDASNKNITTTANSNTKAGVAVAGAATGDVVARVLINM